jgi:hypothetical protein
VQSCCHLGYGPPSQPLHKQCSWKNKISLNISQNSEFVFVSQPARSTGCQQPATARLQTQTNTRCDASYQLPKKTDDTRSSSALEPRPTTGPVAEHCSWRFYCTECRTNSGFRPAACFY